MGMKPFGFVGELMQVRNDVVEEQQKENARPKADDCGNEGELLQIRRIFNGGNQQAPDGCRNHHAAGKACQHPFGGTVDLLF